jgi:hypothetical protein
MGSFAVSRTCRSPSEGEFGDGLQSYAGVGGGDVAFAGSGQGEYNGRLGMKVRW